MPLPFTIQRMLFCLFASHGFSTRYSVCALSLYPLWHAPSGSNSTLLLLGGTSSQQDISPQRSLSKNLRIGFSPLPTARPCPLLPLTHDPSLPILAGYRLVVSGSCACFTFFACCSCICRDLEIGLYVLLCTFGFLWRGLFFRSVILYDLLLLGVGPCRIMGLPSQGPLCIQSVALFNISCHTTLLFLPLFDSILLSLFGSAILFPS